MCNGVSFSMFLSMSVLILVMMVIANSYLKMNILVLESRSKVLEFKVLKRGTLLCVLEFFPICNVMSKGTGKMIM